MESNSLRTSSGAVTKPNAGVSHPSIDPFNDDRLLAALAPDPTVDSSFDNEPASKKVPQPENNFR